MLNLKKLTEASDVLSIRRICKEARLSYFNVHQKIYRYKAKPNQSKLTELEIRRITQTLKKYHLDIEK